MTKKIVFNFWEGLKWNTIGFLKPWRHTYSKDTYSDPSSCTHIAKRSKKGNQCYSWVWNRILQPFTTISTSNPQSVSRKTLESYRATASGHEGSLGGICKFFRLHSPGKHRRQAVQSCPHAPRWQRLDHPESQMPFLDEDFWTDPRPQKQRWRYCVPSLLRVCERSKVLWIVLSCL